MFVELADFLWAEDIPTVILVGRLKHIPHTI